MPSESSSIGTGGSSFRLRNKALKRRVISAPKPKDIIDQSTTNTSNHQASDRWRENVPAQLLPRPSPGTLTPALHPGGPDDHNLSELKSCNSGQATAASSRKGERNESRNASLKTYSWASETKQNLVWQIASEKASTYQSQSRAEHIAAASTALNEIPNRIEGIVTETVKKLVERQKDVDPLNASTAPNLGHAYTNAEAEVHKIWKQNVQKSGQYKQHVVKIQGEIERALKEGEKVGNNNLTGIFDTSEISGGASSSERACHSRTDACHQPKSHKRLPDQQPPLEGHASSTPSGQPSGPGKAPISTSTTTSTDMNRDPCEGGSSDMEMKAFRSKVEVEKELDDRRNLRKETITNTEFYQEVKNITSVVQSQASKTISKLINQASVSSSAIAGGALPTILEDMETLITSDIGEVVNRFVASVQYMDVDLQNRSLSDALLRAKGVTEGQEHKFAAGGRNGGEENMKNTRDGGFQKLYTSGLSGAEASSDAADRSSVAKAFISSRDWTDANEYGKYKKGEALNNRVRCMFGGGPPRDSSSSRKHTNDAQGSTYGDAQAGAGDSRAQKCLTWNDVNARRTETGNPWPYKNTTPWKRSQTQEEGGSMPTRIDEKLLYSGSMSRKRLDDHLDNPIERKLKDKSGRPMWNKLVHGLDSHLNNNNNSMDNEATATHAHDTCPRAPRYIPPHCRAGYGTSSSSKDFPTLRLEKSSSIITTIITTTTTTTTNPQPESLAAHDHSVSRDKTISRELSMDSARLGRSECSGAASNRSIMDANKAWQEKRESVQLSHYEKSNVSWADMSEEWDGNDFTVRFPDEPDDEPDDELVDELVDDELVDDELVDDELVDDEAASSFETLSSLSAKFSVASMAGSTPTSVCGGGGVAGDGLAGRSSGGRRRNSWGGSKRNSGGVDGSKRSGKVRGRSRGRNNKSRRNGEGIITTNPAFIRGSHSWPPQMSTATRRESGIPQQECHDAHYDDVKEEDGSHNTDERTEHSQHTLLAGDVGGEDTQTNGEHFPLLPPRYAYSEDKAYHPLSCGSLGHPDFCSRPCLYFWRGVCNNGSACPFCHHPHRKRPTRLNKRHRQILEKLEYKKVYNMLVPVILEKCEKYDDVAEKMSIILETVRDGPRSPRSVKEKCIVEVINTMPLGHVIQLFKRLSLNKIHEGKKEEFQSVMKDVNLLVEQLKAGKPKSECKRSRSF